MLIVLLLGVILVIFYQRKIDEECLINSHSKSLEACLQDALTVYSAELVGLKILSRVDDTYRMPGDWLGQVMQLNSASHYGKTFLMQAQRQMGFISAKNAYHWAMNEYAYLGISFTRESRISADAEKLMIAV